MNALVGSIRARVAHGYHMTRTDQAIEDVKDLLELVDKLVQSHYYCDDGPNAGSCVPAIMEELGITKPGLPPLPYRCLRCGTQQHVGGCCANCGLEPMARNPEYASNS